MTSFVKLFLYLKILGDLSLRGNTFTNPTDPQNNMITSSSKYEHYYINSLPPMS